MKLSDQQLFGLHKAGKIITTHGSKKNKSVMAQLYLDNLPVGIPAPWGVIKNLKRNSYSHIYPQSRLTIKPA